MGFDTWNKVTTPQELSYTKPNFKKITDPNQKPRANVGGSSKRFISLFEKENFSAKHARTRRSPDSWWFRTGRRPPQTFRDSNLVILFNHMIGHTSRFCKLLLDGVQSLKIGVLEEDVGHCASIDTCTHLFRHGKTLHMEINNNIHTHTHVCVCALSCWEKIIPASCVSVHLPLSQNQAKVQPLIQDVQG